MKTIFGLFCVMALLLSPVKAEEVIKRTYKAIESISIKNLDAALKEAEGDLGFIVFFPRFIPAPTNMANSAILEASQKKVTYR